MFGCMRYARATAFLFLALMVPIARAQAIAQFDLPAQPLADSLRAVGSQTNTNVLFDPPLVAGRRAPALRAALTTDQALSRLLAGSGIAHEFLNDKTVVLSAAASGSTSGISTSGTGGSLANSSTTAQSVSASDGDGKEKEGKTTATATIRLAQSATATSTPSSEYAEENAGLAEVVVTARRKNELLQDVPATVTPVTAADIQNYNFQNLQDVSQLVPSLQIIASDNRVEDTDSFRGVSFNPASGTQNILGFYVNDTFVSNNFVTASIFDVGQIELLSGPQGTLRGEPSPSGSMTITTHRPDLDQFGGYVTGTAADHDSWNGNAAVNMPIMPGKLAVRVAGNVEDNELDGVNSINDSDKPYYHSSAGRISVRFKPIDALEANVMYQDSYWNQGQYQQVEGPGAAGGVVPTAPANYNGPAITPAQMTGVQTYPTVTWNHSEIFTGQIDWHFLNQRLSYNGSYWNYADLSSSFPLTANQVPGITGENPIPLVPFQFNTPSSLERTQTHELRLTSETPLWGFMDYTVGGFFRATANSVYVAQLADFLPGSFG